MTSGIFHAVDCDSITVQARQRVVRSEKHVQQLADSIREVGLINPIVITREHVLVAGECRLTAVRDYLGWTHIPAQYQDEIAPDVLHLIELEENAKRENLHWRDHNAAVIAYHELRKAKDPTWSQAQTAAALNMSQPAIQGHAKVAANMHRPDVAKADTLKTAINTARRLDSREEDDNKETMRINGLCTLPAKPSPVLNIDFNTWAPSYEGPRFNVLHIDFPYGINAHQSAGQNSALDVDYADTRENRDALMRTLVLHLDRFCAESAHMIFWFSPVSYCEIWYYIQSLSGFKWEEHPLVWQRGENEGIAPDPARRPRRVYEMAFFGWRNDRKIIRTKANSIVAPTERERHPHEKSETALLHFFGMCVDGETRLLDPTCGSGSALRAARTLGARTILGLESNPTYAEDARRSLG